MMFILCVAIFWVANKVVCSFRYRLGPGQVGREVFHIVLISKRVLQHCIRHTGELYDDFFYDFFSFSRAHCMIIYTQVSVNTLDSR